jgi:hypothetical protein
MGFSSVRQFSGFGRKIVHYEVFLRVELKEAGEEAGRADDE